MSDVFKLCYVDDGWAYFTNGDVEEQYGDDWGDRPYEHNAGTPYELNGAKIVKLAFSGGFWEEPCDGYTNSPYSVLDINSGAVPWLKNPRKNITILAGTTIEEFKNAILQGDGIFFEQGNKEQITSRTPVLEEAARITKGDRQRDYDHPLPNHQRIATMWNAYLSIRKDPKAPISPEDVAWMMINLKQARDVFTPKFDNLVDTCGYARCLSQMRGWE